jgi:hypothetical protein
MIPEPQDSPPHLSQSAIRITISALIALDFVLPPAGVGFRPTPMLRTAMPKATIDEYGDTISN